MIQILYLYGNPLNELEHSTLTDQQHLNLLGTDKEYLCCLVVKRREVKCKENSMDIAPSCHGFLHNLYMRAFIWLFCILIFVLNITSCFYHINEAKKGKIASRFLAMLSMSDLLQAVYLLTVALKDVSDRHIIILHDQIHLDKQSCLQIRWFYWFIFNDGVTCFSPYYNIRKTAVYKETF